jgi:hypothetical protein
MQRFWLRQLGICKGYAKVFSEAMGKCRGNEKG